ncbi:MCP four helix bundle domain-containing protein [Paracidovorax cattleyae]|uniref:MCP four helix bundle domain-containing protein n=1 Tax=Paracidovorax cattleyae TaxID=80868 RepID=UPI0025A4217E|nr:MCP four helix bundle domain-containing protein [Paracidovorax cattleyae]
MNFSHIKLAPRLGLAFAAMVVLSVFLGLFSLRQMSQLQEQTSTVVDNNLPSVMILSEYRRNLDLMRRVEALLLLETPDKEQGEYRASFDKTVAKFEELNRTYVEPTLIGSPGEAALAAAFKKDLAAYIAAASRIRTSAQDRGQHAELLNHMLNTTRGLYFSTSEQLDKVIQYNVDQAKDASSLAVQILDSGRSWLVVTMVAAAAIAALLAVVIVRSIVHPLDRAIDAAQQVAQGNLAVELRSDGATRCPGCCAPWWTCATRWHASPATSAATRKAWPRPAPRSRRATGTCRPARSSRRLRSSRRRRRWSNWAPPCARMPRAPARPASWRPARRASRARAARWSAKWSRP